MKILTYSASALLLTGALLLGSCNNILDELATNPNQPSLGSYFKDPAAVNEAVLSLYGYVSAQRALGASGSKTLIMRSDEASTNSDYGKAGMYGADLNSSYYTIEQPYTLMYTIASQASFVIETIDEVDFSANEPLRNAYLGEARFWRAFAHFYLLINYRQVSPVRHMPQTAADYARPVEKPAEVWNFIQEDLAEAERLLPAKGYWDAASAGRVTKASAAALLGKAYLYRSGIETHYGDDKTTYYTEAAAEFARIINGDYGAYTLAADYADNFDVSHENNDESILEIQFLGDVNNAGFNPGTATSGLAFDGRGLMLPGTGVGYEGVVHSWLYDAYAASTDKTGATDCRMFATLMFDDRAPGIHLPTDAAGQPIRQKGPGGYTWEQLYPEKDGATGFATVANKLAHPFKAGIKKGLDYTMPTQTTESGQPKLIGVGAGVKEYLYNQPRAHGVNWRYIRYADVLLMYAEAVLSGGTASASISPLQAVNQVRQRARLQDLGALTMDDIKHERVLELALEGHRFFDLLRWGELESRFDQLRQSDANFKKFISADDFKGFTAHKHEWLPIPITEMNSNPYLTENNPGY